MSVRTWSSLSGNFISLLSSAIPVSAAFVAEGQVFIFFIFFILLSGQLQDDATLRLRAGSGGE